MLESNHMEPNWNVRIDTQNFVFPPRILSIKIRNLITFIPPRM